MGTDNLFHRRKGNSASALSRRPPSRNALPLYLIVCEGEKTEPNYFNELRNFERISTVHVRVYGECDSAPGSVVKFALEMYETLKEEGQAVDGVFCVFDKDNHSTFFSACALIEKSRAQGIPIQASYSIPCFEYWLILHFEFCRAPFGGKGKVSVAGVVAKALSGHMKYKKGQAGIYQALKHLQQDAIRNAKLAVADYEATGNDNPLTYVHDLVEKLLEFAE